MHKSSCPLPRTEIPAGLSRGTLLPRRTPPQGPPGPGPVAERRCPRDRLLDRLSPQLGEGPRGAGAALSARHPPLPRLRPAAGTKHVRRVRSRREVAKVMRDNTSTSRTNRRGAATRLRSRQGRPPGNAPRLAEGAVKPMVRPKARTVPCALPLVRRRALPTVETRIGECNLGL